MLHASTLQHQIRVMSEGTRIAVALVGSYTGRLHLLKRAVWPERTQHGRSSLKKINELLKKVSVDSLWVWRLGV